MARSANSVLEVRNGGSDTNGGGFVTGASGTDHTLQDAAQYSVTDGVTNGTTTITSATASFGTDVVGNWMYVSGGTGSVTADWYEITVRVSATEVTVDRSTGLTAGTGVTLKIGGAFASPGRASNLMVSGNLAFIKYHATAYSITTATLGAGGPCNFTGGDSYGAFVGYDTTRTFMNTDANRPTILATVGSITMVGSSSGSYQTVYVRNLIADGDNQTSVYGFSLNSYGVFNAHNCKAVDCTSNGFAQGRFTFCKAENCGSSGFDGGSYSPSVAVGCWADGCGTYGFSTSVQNIACFGCIASNCAIGFHVGACFNCVAYNSTGDGFDRYYYLQFDVFFINCISYESGAYGFDIESRPASGLIFHCAGGSNTSGTVVNATDANWQNQEFITLTADPFTNAAAGDFSLNNVAGGGALLRGLGFPGVFPGGLTTGYLDVGAVQHYEPTPAEVAEAVWEYGDRSLTA